MALTKLEGIECPTEIANLINQIIDQKSSIDLNDLSEVGEKRFTDLKTSINSLNSALSTLTTTVNSKLSAQVLKAQNGYIKFSNGFLIQWGTSSLSLSSIGEVFSKDIKLPIAFSSIVIPIISRTPVQQWGQIHATIKSLNTGNIRVSMYAHDSIAVPTIQEFYFLALGY